MCVYERIYRYGHIKCSRSTHNAITLCSIIILSTCTISKSHNKNGDRVGLAQSVACPPLTR